MRQMIPLFLILLCLGAAAQPLAAPDWQTERDLQGVRDLFTALQQAYTDENVNQFLGCFDPILPAVDIPRETHEIITAAQMRTELTELFAMLDDIRMDFLDLDIVLERDTAIVNTLRRGRALGTPIIFVRLILTLNKNGHGWGGHNWRIVNQVLVDEWYDFTRTDAAPQSETNTLDGEAKKIKRPSLF